MASNPSDHVSHALFAGIYDSELGYVWNTLKRLGIPERDVEDLSHDLFLVVHRRLSTYDPARPLRPWLFGIAFRVASEYRRKASNKNEILSEPDEPAVEAQGEALIETKQARALVARALDGLSLDQRAVFVMCELDHMSVPEVAEALSIPLNTAYSRLRLARGGFTKSVRQLQRGAS